MENLKLEFETAKQEYQELIKKDFPDFELDEYINEKALEVDASDRAKGKEKDNKTKFTNKLRSSLDINGDGKINKSDVAEKTKHIAKGTISVAKKFGEKANQTISSFDASKIASEAKSTVAKVGDTMSNTEVSDITGTVAKIGKTATGIQGIQNRKDAKTIMEICSEYYDAAEKITEEKREKLNYAITDFGEYRLNALHVSVGRFLEYLKKLKQKNAVKEYEILIGAEIDTETLDKIERIDMAASEALRTTAITGAFGAVAVMGTPALVTGTVAAFATASTGTAISSLSGAAANSAVMAWLGGGSLAAGGGGVAAGTATLAALTVGATAVTAILAAGCLVSLHYGKKLTEAKEYEKDVGVAVASLEKAWIVMDAISKRTSELREVTEELKWRTASQLDELESLIFDFDFADKDCVSIFNKCAIMIKTMVELSQTPILNDEGNLSTESLDVTVKVKKILNTEV